MNELPPPNEGLDDVDERYRQWSDRDSSRPGEAVRRAVLVHAAELAAQARTEKSPVPIESRSPAANEPRWRVATYGGLAAAALAGLLIAPHFLTPSTAPPAPTAAPAPAAPLARASPPPAYIPEHAAPAAAPPAPAPTAPASAPAARAQITEPRAFAGNVSPSQNPALGEIAGKAAAPAAQSRARENTPARLAQMQSMAAQSDAATASAAALRQAAQSGNVQRLQALLSGRIDIDARDPNGRTALMLAVLDGQKEAVDSLLAAGADPNAGDTSGTTPLEAALAGARPEIAAALRRAGAR